MTTAAFRPTGLSQITIIALIPAVAAWCLLDARLGSSAMFAAIALVPAGVAAVVDLGSHRIPDELVVATLVPSFVSLVSGAATAHSVMLGAAAMGLPLLAVHLIAPESIGFGDVKLGASLGAALGVVDGRLALPALMLASAATLLIALARRRSSLPFAPALVVAALALLLLEPAIRWGAA